MYSLMSMRTIACSSSKRYSASARASSVLPTPVGPRKRNDPIGRFGSERPARERRMALATAVTAWSRPTTRVGSSSSMRTSLSTSPSSNLETGTPVQRLITSAMSSAATSDVKYEGKKALVCLVGEDIRGQNGMAAQVFSAIRHINVRMISQGASEINMSFMIEEDDADEAVRSLHATFFQNPDPDIFDVEARK